MPVATLLAGIATAVVVDAVLLVVVTALLVRGRRRAGRDGPGVGVFAGLDAGIAAAITAGDGKTDAVPAGTYDRVVRVGTWSFLLTTAVMVSATGLWPASQPALLAILVIAGLFLVIAHDVLPAGALGRGKYLAEGLVAIVIVSLIVVLTGGARSPFFFAYALVVAGAALVIPPGATVAITALSAMGYLAITTATAANEGLDAAGLALVGINLSALVLLAYVAMVVGREQRRTRDAAIRLSTTDALTGLANRAFVLAAVDREIERATRFGRGFCLLMADLDDLKLINDTYGHRLGDRVLVAVAGVIRDGIRRIDVPARLGGDEFIVLLPETDESGASVVAEKIRLGVRSIEATARDTQIRISVSIGLVSFPDDGINRDDLMNAVDEAMYASKRQGKDRVGGLGGRLPPSELTAFGPGYARPEGRSYGADRAARAVQMAGMAERAS